MTFEEYQQLAARTMNQNLDDEETEWHALFEMCSEVGEIHGIYQKYYQGHEIDIDALTLEIGDLLWGIAELCTVNSINLDTVAERNIAKLRKRYPDGFDVDRSLNRGDES